jgi:hypothetical protein
MTVNLPVARPTHLHRPLAVLATLTGVLAVVLLPATALDDRQLLGVSVWLKPWKFAVSITIYWLTVAWMVTLLHTGARLARALDCFSAGSRPTARSTPSSDGAGGDDEDTA